LTWCETKRQAAGIKITHSSKISILAPQGRLIAPIHLKLGMAKGTVGLLGHAKFHANQCTGWERGPKSWKFPLFGKELPSKGTPFDQFLQFLRAFICPTILH